MDEMKHKLICREPGKDPEPYDLDPKVGIKITIGFGAENDISLGGLPYLSEHHATIYPSNGRYYIEDHSTNGTIIKKTAYDKGTLIRNKSNKLETDDIITFRDSDCQIDYKKGGTTVITTPFEIEDSNKPSKPQQKKMIEIHVDTKEVYVNGKQLKKKLTGNGLYILEHLLANEGKLISHHKLGEVISEKLHNSFDIPDKHAIKTAIYRLHEVLNASGEIDSRQYIKGERNRGYVLNNKDRK